MFVRAANFLLKFPAIRRQVWRWSYNELSNKLPGSSFNFLNYGYVCQDGETPPTLHAEDEASRLCIQLYHRLHHVVDVRGKAVLEVGCGRGGGAAYIAKYLAPKRMVGVDAAKRSIVHCRRAHAGTICEFTIGYAEDLPFKDEEFDVVVNIESSHCYRSMDAFLAQVARVLKPGGTFFWQDVNAARDDDPRMTNLDSSRLPANLVLIHEEGITGPVMEAMDLMNDERERMLTAMFPTILRRAAFEDFGLKGTQFYKDMATRKIVYLSRAYTKR